MHLKLDFNEATVLPIKLFRLIGIELEREATRRTRIIRNFNITTVILIFLLQVDYLTTWNYANKEERTSNISHFSFYLMGAGKACSTIYYRRELMQCLLQFRACFPERMVIRHYGLESYLRRYKYVQWFMVLTVVGASIMFNFEAMAKSFYDWLANGAFSYQTTVGIRFPLPVEQWPIQYIVCYTIISVTCMVLTYSILCCDLLLLVCITILSMNLKLLAMNISELQTGQATSLQELNSIAARHAQITELKGNVNRIFVPSILFGLLISSFLICFSAFSLQEVEQLSHKISMALAIIYFFISIMIVCGFGEMLMEASEEVHTALYMHNWVDGSFAYRKQVLFMMMHTQQPLALQVAGVADISLETLQKVMGMTYKLFTMLNST